MLSWRGHEIARMRHDLRSWYDEDNGIFWIPPYHFLQPLANQKRIYMLSSHVRHALVMWESEAIRVLMGQYYEGTIIND